MDAFEIRMQFLQHLRRLTSAAQSINKVVAFLLKHSRVQTAASSTHQLHHETDLTLSSAPASASALAAAGVATETVASSNLTTPTTTTTTITTSTTAAVDATHEEADLWECILEELGEKASINTKINLFYMLDSLLAASAANEMPAWKAFVARDLEKVVALTVPRDVGEGVLNRMSAMQVLDSWKTRRLFPSARLDALLDSLRHASFASASVPASIIGEAPAQTKTATTFSRNDILRRIEDDRERHKRLRERIWVLPSLEAEFDQAWEAAATASAPSTLTGSEVAAAGTTKLQEADYAAMELENARCFGAGIAVGVGVGLA